MIVAQSCLILCDPVGPPGSSVHGILQARILEWVANSSSRGSSRPSDGTQVSCISCSGRWILLPLCHLGSSLGSLFGPNEGQEGDTAGWFVKVQCITAGWKPGQPLWSYAPHPLPTSRASKTFPSLWNLHIFWTRIGRSWGLVSLSLRPSAGRRGGTCHQAWEKSQEGSNIRINNSP